MGEGSRGGGVREAGGGQKTKQQNNIFTRLFFLTPMKLRKRAVVTVLQLCGLMSNLLHGDVRQTAAGAVVDIFNLRGGTTRATK